MSNALVINRTGQETRVALIENGSLAELYIERKFERGIVGNVYKGRVVRVLPGMQAAFVNIGTDRAAFLYVSDVLQDHFAYTIEDEEFDENGEAEAGEDEQPKDGKTAPRPAKRRRKPGSHSKIEDLIKEGQEIMVQVAKDPIGTKGARVTCHITLPGRHLVFMPTVSHIGISRRITVDKERRRLRQLVDDFRPEGSGFIVRTAAEKEPVEHLRSDMQMLVKLWGDTLEKRDKLSAPALLHSDFDLILRVTRDLVTNDVSTVIVDDPEQYERIPAFFERFMAGFSCDVELYTGKEPIFEAFGLEIEIERALDRKVWLKSGAHLVIDQTEALTAIDINTGKYVGKTNLEDTITKINLEAVDEIIYQLRLRNIGGLIVIDFIDMESRDNRERVYKALAKATTSDKTRSNILKISDFGLVEMTRKRVKQNLVQQLCDPCPYCDGRGHIKSEITMTYQILRKLTRVSEVESAEKIVVKTHSAVNEIVKRQERNTIKAIEKRTSKKLQLRSSQSLHREDFSIEIK